MGNYEMCQKSCRIDVKRFISDQHFTLRVIPCYATPLDSNAPSLSSLPCFHSLLVVFLHDPPYFYHCSLFDNNNNNNGYFKCYFSGEHIALSIKKQKNNNNCVNIELGKTNRLKALCMIQINT